ncbi:MAG TPA: tRNA (adenosine(37)-N6)-dimethylallyltransferase MiaA [Burkholderiales bacterium]
MTHPAALCIMGPTACGKSALALALADALGGEIISVDSAQVFRGMDLGTAKPSAAERAAVPHHLLDLIAPTEAYSAGRFLVDARAAIADIRARGRLPILAGGTMLYFKALLEGLDALPAADPDLRRKLDDEAAKLGWPALHARLAAIDPDSAARIAPGDAQRIQRALEVFERAGRPLSVLQGQARAKRFDAYWVALVPAERAALHARIARRFDAMLAAGLVDELRALRNQYDLQPTMPSMRCVGYRQAWQHLDGELDAKALREKGIAATRQLAKRQLTWLRTLRADQAVDPLAEDASAAVRAAWQAAAD